MTGAITARFIEVEATFLIELVEQYRELVAEGTASDPAVARLTPAAYRDDDEAAREFSAFTRADLLSGRAAEADRVLADLTAARTEPGGDVLVTIDDDATSPWLRTLTGLRLVLAARLGLENDATADDDEPTDDPRYGAYEWLGYRLELLLQSLGD